jgi:hypothetical protein
MRLFEIESSELFHQPTWPIYYSRRPMTQISSFELLAKEGSRNWKRTKLTVSSWIVVPATIASVALGAVIVIAANGVTAKLEPEGQEEMNPAAREKTERIPRGVSKAEGTAIALEATRINVECRASTVTISAATTRLDAVVIKGAAPR